ncbi:MAG: hypothetical protein Nkreftii_002274 [Candidatus Nitrospira kreftii]|uniref:Uncharacterized protein n=1 Tax=Candidatus Nitrospira kreftii TaxID=2652173 RepID=A0A7S8IZZ4_9BACT|nr:MAG: hypothetical protein Nkreftii_002274 [Candidatus Nitrospira kreftii]
MSLFHAPHMPVVRWLIEPPCAASQSLPGSTIKSTGPWLDTRRTDTAFPPNLDGP